MRDDIDIFVNDESEGFTKEPHPGDLVVFHKDYYRWHDSPSNIGASDEEGDFIRKGTKAAIYEVCETDEDVTLILDGGEVVDWVPIEFLTLVARIDWVDFKRQKGFAK